MSKKNQRTTKRKLTAKDFMRMNKEQRAKATADLDEECVIDKFRPLNEQEKRQWEKAKRKVGRPKVGDGAHRISVTVEKQLLAKADKLAKKLDVTRAALINRGLTLVLEKENGK